MLSLVVEVREKHRPSGIHASITIADQAGTGDASQDSAALAAQV